MYDAKMSVDDDEINDVCFVDVLKGFFKLTNVPLAAFADRLGVSRPTVERWLQGKNLPHPGMRRPVINAVEHITKEHVT